MQEDIDFENRRLCPDETCIGVLDENLRCSECGRREGEAAVSDAPVSEPSVDGDPQWEERRLCSDGACIGVIGEDGRCRECGAGFEAGGA